MIRPWHLLITFLRVWMERDLGASAGVSEVRNSPLFTNPVWERLPLTPSFPNSVWE